MVIESRILCHFKDSGASKLLSMANNIIMTNISLKCRNKSSNLVYLKILKCAKLLDIHVISKSAIIKHLPGLTVCAFDVISQASFPK